MLDTSEPGRRRNSAGGVAEKEMENYYTSMTDLFSSAFPDGGDDKPKLVIALDEAHPLQELKEFRCATVLLRVINAYSAYSPLSYAVWVVFASTTSKVAHTASPQSLFNSARVSILGELLFPPFSEMGWDHYAPPLGTVPSSEVAKAKHILRYGRPL
ncbi:hypothetical protein J3R83DRAFT_4505 [Lanmaoa asiatica]|nr:hypothetical protein J3R83DRAFT_4505 [Lanmaoa asiatica]